MVTYAATLRTVPHVERKDPSDILDYLWDWSDWLETGETLTTVTWDVPTGLTQDDDDIGTTTATAWLSGGTAGETYTVGCLVTTSMGRTCERSCRILVAER
jgi:hypothetical protein